MKMSHLSTIEQFIRAFKVLQIKSRNISRYRVREVTSNCLFHNFFSATDNLLLIHQIPSGPHWKWVRIASQQKVIQTSSFRHRILISRLVSKPDVGHLNPLYVMWQYIIIQDRKVITCLWCEKGNSVEALEFLRPFMSTLDEEVIFSPSVSTISIDRSEISHLENQVQLS